MFCQIKSGSIINLAYAAFIKAEPYEGGYRIVAEFSDNYEKLSGAIGVDVTEDGQVVLLRGPCTKVYAEEQLKKLDTINPLEREYYCGNIDIKFVHFNIRYVASVVKRRKSEGYNVIANLALGQNIQIDMMPDPLCEDDADGFLNLLASSWNAIQFEE